MKSRVKNLLVPLATRARDLVVRVIIDGVRRVHLVIQGHATPLDLVFHEVEAVDHGLDVVIERSAHIGQMMDPLRDGPHAQSLGEGIREGAAVFSE